MWQIAFSREKLAKGKARGAEELQAENKLFDNLLKNSFPS